MRKKLTELLVCPKCHEALDCQPELIADDGDIRTGSLRCAGCQVSYPIERGIPRFVPTGNYATSFGYQWNRFRQEQIDSLNGTRQAEERLRNETAWDSSRLYH